LPLLLVVIILAVANMPSGIFQKQDGFPTIIELFMGLFVFAYMLFVLAPIRYGAALLFVKASRNEYFETKELFNAFSLNYLNVILANLLVAAIVMAGIISLIIPGIVFACRLAFVPYLVMDKNLDPVKAVEQSWRMTKGYGWRIFFMLLLAFPILILGLLLFVVGITVAIMWIKTAFASLYIMVDQIKKPQVVIPDNQSDK
jgi:uncharacterized membrane protein